MREGASGAHPMRHLSIVFSLLAVSACNFGYVADTGGAGDPPPADDDLRNVRGQPIPGLISTELSPRDTTQALEGPAELAFTAVGIFADGRREDITDKVVFALDRPGFGRFSASTLMATGAQGGRATVVASAGAVSGT